MPFGAQSLYAVTLVVFVQRYYVDANVRVQLFESVDVSDAHGKCNSVEIERVEDSRYLV